MTRCSSDFEAFLAACAPGDLPEGVETLSSVVCLATPGTPVVYVSDAFESHTGYSRAEAIGRSLSFLQGPGTEPEAVVRFQDLIARRVPGTVRITNYRRDGTPFTHLCELRPVFDSNGMATHFVAVQRPGKPTEPADSPDPR
jgi:PAS domain S-box-containing protein